MRGGEKCLEVLCRSFPGATLHTLFHRRGSLSPAIESMAIQTSPLQHVPGIFRVLSPSSAAHAAGRAVLAAQGRRPRRQPESLRRQGGRAAAGGSARLLLLHADALRLAGPGRVPRKLVGSTDPPGPGPHDTGTTQALGSRDRAAGDALRGDLGDGPRSGSRRLTDATAR